MKNYVETYRSKFETIDMVIMRETAQATTYPAVSINLGSRYTNPLAGFCFVRKFLAILKTTQFFGS